MPRVWIKGVPGAVHGGHQYTFGSGWTEVQPWNLALDAPLYFEEARELACHAIGKAGMDLSPGNYHEGDGPPAEMPEPDAPEPEPVSEKPEKKAKKK